MYINEMKQTFLMLPLACNLSTMQVCYYSINVKTIIMLKITSMVLSCSVVKGLNLDSFEYIAYTRARNLMKHKEYRIKMWTFL